MQPNQYPQQDPYANEPFEDQPTVANPRPVPPYDVNNPPREAQYPYAPNSVPPRDERQPYPYVAPENAPRPAYNPAAAQERAKAKYGVAKVMDFIRWIVIVLEVLFGLRFLLKLIGADPYNPFASFLCGLTSFFLYPFQGLVSDLRFGTPTVHYFEWTTLIGMLIYALLFWLVWLLLRTTISRPEEPVS
jgi:hypothetical protein